jgi:hypothetical protein
MRSDAVVIISIGFQNSAQVRLAQDNDVVHALTPDRSDQPFHKAILPGRCWCNGLTYNGTRTHLSLNKDAPISRAAEAVGRIISRPILGRRAGDAEHKPFKPVVASKKIRIVVAR